MNKHTPGPWSVGLPNLKEESEVGIHGPGEYGFIICDMHEDGYCKETQKANASLIAAAPMLLEALERIVSAARDLDNGYMDQAISQADEAIAKARGQS